MPTDSIMLGIATFFLADNIPFMIFIEHFVYEDGKVALYSKTSMIIETYSTELEFCKILLLT